MTAREKLANYIKSTLGGLSAKHMLEMADASAAAAVAAEREAVRKMIEDIRAKPWHRSALVQSAERETCDRILVELGQRTKPAQEGTNCETLQSLWQTPARPAERGTVRRLRGESRDQASDS